MARRLSSRALPGGTDNLVSNDTNDQTQLYVASFGTLPAATTEAATSISATGATLNASVNPEGTAITYDFVYGTSASLSSGTTTTSSASAGSGTSAVSETAALTGLTPSTKYYFKVVATNSGGSTPGTILNFTTSAAVGTPPGATTKAATSITSTGAAVNTSVNPEGAATTYSFVYGTSPTLSSGPTSTPAQSAGSGTSSVAETLTLSGLASGTTYSFEVKATNSGGTGAGAILSFATPAILPPPVAITSLAHPTIKVGTGTKAKKEAVLQLQLSGPLSSVGELAAYMLDSGKTKKGKTTYTKPVALTSVVYDYSVAPSNTVTIFLKSKLNLAQPEQLTINGSLITDTHGRPLAQSYVVQFSNKDVTIQ